MAEPHGLKLLRFEKTEEELFSLWCVGYNDFRYLKSSHRSRVMNKYTIHFVRSGKGTLHIYGKTFSVKAGDMFFIPTRERVLYYPDEVAPWRYYWISLHSSTAGTQLARTLGFDRDVPVRAARDPERIQQRFDALFEADSPTREVYYQTLSVLMEIVSFSCVAPEAQGREIRRESFADEVKTILRLNCDNPDFTVEDVSQMLYMTHAHMCRLFKAETGLTPVFYLIAMRLERAALLLQERPYSVRELCEASGFRDEAHFMKQFKKKYGVTVKEYRKNCLP